MSNIGIPIKGFTDLFPACGRSSQPITRHGAIPGGHARILAALSDVDACCVAGANAMQKVGINAESAGKNNDGA